METGSRAFPSVKYFPVLLRLEGWECAVLGTAEAARPYRAVLEGHGARVRVVVPPVRRGDLVGVRLSWPSGETGPFTPGCTGGPGGGGSCAMPSMTLSIAITSGQPYGRPGPSS